VPRVRLSDSVRLIVSQEMAIPRKPVDSARQTIFNIYTVLGGKLGTKDPNVVVLGMLNSDGGGDSPSTPISL
jgi:hypothetical protein